MRKVLLISILSSVLLLLGNAVAYAQASSSVFKDSDNPIDVSQLWSKVTASGPRPVAGDVISGVIRDAEDWPGMPGPVIPREGDTFPLLLHNGKLASFPEGSRDRLNSFDFERYYNDPGKLARLFYGIKKGDIKEVKVIKNTEAVAKWFVWGINGALDVITK